jgi:hypothetical protein
MMIVARSRSGFVQTPRLRKQAPQVAQVAFTFSCPMPDSVRTEHNGVELNMRRVGLIAVALLFPAAPTDLKSDRVFDATDTLGWTGMADAVARVRFEAQEVLTSDEDGLTRHTATVLGIFKRNEVFPLPLARVDIIEWRAFMQTEDGNWPCWDNRQPLPVGTEAMVLVRWDAHWRAFRLLTVAYVRLGKRVLRVRRSSRLCELNDW